MRRLILSMAIVAASSAAFAQPPDDWTFNEGRDGVHLRILRNYHLAENEISREPVVVIGGSATIDGRAERDVTVIGGTLRIGPTAVIRGDVVTVGGRATIDPAAQIAGGVEQAEVLFPNFTLGFGPLFDAWWPMFRLGATVMRLGTVFIVALLLTVVAPRWLDELAHHAGSSPATSAVIGVTGQVLFVPASVALAIALAMSIIGIPLLLAFPFLFAAAALLWVAGFAAVARTLGARIRGKYAGVSDTPMFDLLTGFLLITVVTLTANALPFGPGPLAPFGWMLRAGGWLIEWMAWTVGLGAGLAWLFGRRQPVTPPPVPWPSPAPVSAGTP